MLTGKVIGHYRIGEHLGTGGLGAVGFYTEYEFVGASFIPPTTPERLF